MTARSKLVGSGPYPPVRLAGPSGISVVGEAVRPPLVGDAVVTCSHGLSPGRRCPTLLQRCRPGRWVEMFALPRRVPRRTCGPWPPTPSEPPTASARSPGPSRWPGADGVCGWLAAGHHYPRRIWGYTRIPVAASGRDRERGASSWDWHAIVPQRLTAARSLRRIQSWGIQSWQLDGRVAEPRGVSSRGEAPAGWALSRAVSPYHLANTPARLWRVGLAAPLRGRPGRRR